jgi:molybdopterin molybdotransferase
MADGQIDLATARERVLEAVAPLPAEGIAIEDALGRVLAGSVAASEDVPGSDNSAMDGYAVLAGDVAAPPVDLVVAGESRAGSPSPVPLQPGRAIAISTGAVVPEGADAVVRVEDTERDGDSVRVRASVPAGANIRRAGEDLRRGEEALAAGTVLGPAELGVLALANEGRPRCARRPKVAILTTGDELQPPGEELRPGGVRDSNAHAVRALVRDVGAEPVSTRHAGDDADATRTALESALGADVVVVCGGVSVGAHDHVRPALAELGAEQRFWGVALRPGHPTWFGTRGGTLVFGLPGNPVSAMVTFILFARPALLAMMGARPLPPRARATLSAPVKRRSVGTQAVRCRLAAGPDGLVAEPTGPQGSHILTSMLGADCFAFLDPGEGEAEAGTEVEIEPLRMWAWS